MSRACRVMSYAIAGRHHILSGIGDSAVCQLTQIKCSKEHMFLGRHNDEKPSLDND